MCVMQKKNVVGYTERNEVRAGGHAPTSIAVRELLVGHAELVLEGYRPLPQVQNEPPEKSV